MRTAGGEMIAGADAARVMCERRLYDVLMPDIKYAGGFAGMGAIARVCAEHGVGFAPHNPTGPIAHVASIHACAAAPAVLRPMVPFCQVIVQQMLARFVLAPNLRSDRHRALLNSMALGDTLLALAISEPGTGAHPKHLSCRAVRDGDDWLLDGHKAFVSNGPAADAMPLRPMIRPMLRGRPERAATAV